MLGFEDLVAEWFYDASLDHILSEFLVIVLEEVDVLRTVEVLNHVSHQSSVPWKLIVVETLHQLEGVLNDFETFLLCLRIGKLALLETLKCLEGIFQRLTHVHQ